MADDDSQVTLEDPIALNGSGESQFEEEAVESTAPEPLNDSNHPPVSQRELWGWYFYDFANSVYSSVAIGGFLPVLVTDMAKFYAAEHGTTCNVQFGSISFVPTAFSSFFISGSVLFQAVFFILTSSMADFGTLRKRMMVGTAMAGALLTMLFIFLGDVELYWLAAVLLVLSNVLFGYSVVFYNSYLPFLVRSHPDYIKANVENRTKEADRLSNMISTRGFMFGYVAGVFLLVVSVIVIFLTPSTPRNYYDCTDKANPVLVPGFDKSLALRIAILLTGVWWFAFTFFTMFWVQPRPGPSLPPGKNYITASLGSLSEMVRSVRKLPNTLRFLACYFLFADAYTTVSSVGVLFASYDLKAPETSLGIMLIEVPLLAFVGNWVWLWIKNKFNLSSKTMVTLTLIGHTILPVYSLIGLIDWIPIGLKNQWELFLFAGFYGFNIGAVQSFCRALFLTLVPPGHESEFFGFYELADKGSSWIGPLIVALLAQWTGSLRYGNIWLVISFVVPIFFLQGVDVEKGAVDAKAYSAHATTRHHHSPEADALTSGRESQDIMLSKMDSDESDEINAL